MKKTNDSANVINISKKAYDDFTCRIRRIFIEQMDAPSIAKEVLALLDRYVKGESVAIGEADRVAQIAFMMILPEIDRAIARSKAARLRAAIRKMNREQAVSSVPAQEMQPACTVDDTVQPDNGEVHREAVQLDAVNAAEASDFVAAQIATGRSNDAEACDKTGLNGGVESQNEIKQPNEIETQDATTLPVMMNRRERRERERALRRELKREQRRQACMNK